MGLAGARIKFPGNPWPRGHRVEAAEWTAVLDPEGLHFHLHLVSEAYDAEDDREDEELDDDWKARIVWTNYHRCSLSSTKWGSRGFLVATPGKPIDLDRLEGKTFRVDRVQGDELPAEIQEEPAFNIYLLGHDSVADHRIRFVKRRGSLAYDVTWKARIALTYAGSSALVRRLDATIPKLRLERIDLAAGFVAKAARALLPDVVAHADRYVLEKRAFVRRRSGR